ncbi:TolB-like 6-bladed beta-propeller domain-containing protein [Mariniradius sediminis]|uniref:TolB-like 6-bladed beta-propeller domain-containing protein n=1 Tax=Mariniradius sediminis TaxID=2909237 RepID=A0ABS9BWG0_9BACT|nr:TolB-like 6-bladed beta-propeller domain-containing protein [Mariniradius sediminis]MCF1752410.1 TolB-like 6-bladed beta-propeller domain-containing protein [Mariniradius sediminis]
MARIKALLLLFLALGSGKASSQESEWGDFVAVEFPRLDKISLDNQDFLFVADPEGNLYQYNLSGQRINNFSPPRQGRLTQLEAFWTVNIFTFSTDLQEYRILDRFINPISENKIPAENIALAKAVTLGNNNIIWILDETDLSIKQFDFRTRRILQQQPLNLVLENTSLDVLDIREHQNLLFLNIAGQGIYIFDNQGNFIKRLQVFPNGRLSFWKGYLFLVEKDSIRLVDFQSGAEEQFKLSLGTEVTGILVNRKAVILYNNRGFRIYQKENTPLKGY